MDEVAIGIRLKNAAQFVRDGARAAGTIRNIKDQTGAAGRAARIMGGAYSSASSTMSRGLGAAASQAKYLSIGLGAVGVAGIKMGLSFNAQIENARLRFSLFTDDVDGLTKSVQKIDMTSAFNFGDLSDAAAMLGGSGVADVPKTLQAIANAAAAGGKGTEGLKSISIALSQIQTKGRLSQEELNQLSEGGALTATRDLTKGLGLTAKQLQNLGNQGIDAKKAIDVLTQAWTSGQMADMAEKQTKTLGGQWDMLTGNMRKLSGAATAGLSMGLEHDVLPAANRAVTAITAIFGDKGLTDKQKFSRARAVIRKELGPVWTDIKKDIDEADIPDKLGSAVKAATPMILDAMADIAPKAAKAFVDGWLASGPEAQVITALFLGNKLRKSAFGKSVLSGSGAKDAAKTALGSRGASPENPVWVAMIDAPGKGKGDTVKNIAKKAAPLAAAARFAAPAAGLGAVLLAEYELAHATRHNNFPSRAGGAALRGQAAGTAPAPGFGSPGMGMSTARVDVSISGQKFASVYAPYQQIEDGRAAAMARARK